MCGFRGKCPKIPLHVMVAQATICAAFLRADEVLELHGIADEKYRSIVSNHIVDTFACIELQSETTRIAPGIRASLLFYLLRIESKCQFFYRA